ncbi:DUF4350 domain-containing protein [Planctomonas sp. JC2975]|uniref:DUF4350 domain-containing protein n=1 Tax=Planctomonas sp. JC2975 TaxID=2729626 RepID=UPI00197B7205|nr:DUF4350 domain-containing protein [Planctomonas sp. JC2975]
MTATAPVLSSTPRQSLRRARGWIVLIVILLVGAGIATAIQLSLATSTLDPMGADNPAPQGAQALARVLQEHGVDVRTASTLEAARQAASERDDTTVLLSDPSGFLDAAQSRTVLGLGVDVVAVGPGFAQLQAIAPDVRLAGHPVRTASSTPGCDVAAADRAESVAGVDTAFRVTGDAVGCFPLGSLYALAQARSGDTTVSAVGAAILENDGIQKAGNAALAIGLLGSHRTLVWYLPSAADATASGVPTIAELTPGWLTPAIILLIAVVVAAAIWRGRRFGPLVVEDLPVVIRASETIDGRAQLYRRASARSHALDALRVGALRRIGRLCGLPPNAYVDQIVIAAAGLTGRPLVDVREALVDSTPGTDAEALATASVLEDLEHEVRLAVGGATDTLGRPAPEGTEPPAGGAQTPPVAGPLGSPATPTNTTRTSAYSDEE